MRRSLISAAACTALMIATAWATLAAGWVQNAGGAVVVAAAATIEAALLARAAIPRLLALVLAPILALAAIVPTTIGAMPFDGDPRLGHVVSRYAAALFSGLSSTSDWPFAVGLCAMLWLVGFWVGWLAMRERRGILAILPVYAVLASVALNARRLDPVGLPLAAAVFFSLFVVADSHFDALQTRWLRRGIASLPGTRTRFAVSVAVVSLGLTLVALLIPPATSADISSRFFGGTTIVPGGGDESSGRSNAATIQFSENTEPGGALVSQPKPVLTYTTSEAAPLYIPVVVDTEFASGNWFTDSPDDSSDGVIWGGVSFGPGGLPRDTNVADGAVFRDEVPVAARFEITGNASGGGNLAPMIGDPVGVSEPGVAFGEDSPNGQLLTLEALALENNVVAGQTFDLTADISVATVPELRSAGTDYPSYVLRDEVAPDAGSGEMQIISQIARRWTRGLTNPYDIAAAIESHLRDPAEFQYTLSPPLPPSGSWPIVHFLTVTHRGYCQYFASTMGAMLRSLGIPTRLVNGYGPGAATESGGIVKPPPGQIGAGTGSDRTAEVTTSDAHTWVQVFFPSYGWISFEPTPSSTEGIYGPLPRGKAAVGVGSNAVSTPTPAPGTRPGKPTQSHTTNGSGLSTSHGSAPVIALGVAGGVIAFAIIAASGWLLWPRSLPAAWRRLEALGRFWGVPRRPWETYRDYAKRFAMAPAPVATAINEMAVLLGRAEFSRDGIDSQSSRRALSNWHSVLRAAPLFTWRRRRRLLAPAR